MEARIVTLNQLNELLAQGATIHHIASAGPPTNPQQWVVIVTMPE